MTHSRHSVLLVLLVLSVGVVSPVGAAAQQTDTEVETVTRVDLETNGDAVVTIEIRTRLEDEEDEEAFERARSRIEENRSEVLAEFQQSIGGLVERAVSETDRDMSTSSFTVETEIVEVPRRWGIVRYQFEWSGFAVVDEDTIRMDGALSGYVLSEDDSLVIVHPETYAPVDAEPQPDVIELSRVVWRGPAELSSSEPRLTLTREEVIESESDLGRTALSVLFALGLLVVVTAILLVGWNRYGVGGSVGSSSTSDGRSEPKTAIADIDAARHDDVTTDSVDEVDEKLADTERILHILATEDGRVRQQDLVSRTGWSETKVSKVTSALESEGRIVKLRIGRENVVDLVEDEE